MDNITFERQMVSSVTLANAGQLVHGVITAVAGNDISNGINGSVLTHQLMQTLACQRIISKVKEDAKASQR
jgi:hypothetical protein